MDTKDGRVADATGLSQAEPKVSVLSGFDPSRESILRQEVIAVINEMSRYLPHSTEDWRARLTEALR